MKQLILMRHAKSSGADRNQPDRDRLLNPRGESAARRIGEWLRARGHQPDVALVSDAVRTQQTWSLLADVLDPHPMLPQPKLYAASPAIMLSILHGAGHAATVLMIGHQPGIGGLARALLRTVPDRIDPDQFPTAATVIIEFDADAWSEIAPRSGRLVDFMIPRELPAISGRGSD